MMDRADAWQQRHPAPAFVVAVWLRFREDRGQDYAALLTYYGFISLFPLLVVLITLLGIVLDGNADLRNRILDSVFARIPVVGTQLRETTTGLTASGWLLLVGLVVALWSGLAVAKRAEDAFNLQWGVPRFPLPSFATTQLRALGSLLVIGVGIVAGTAATSVAAALPGLPWAGRVVGSAVAIAVNVAMLMVFYRVLLRSAVRWRDLLPGGVVGGTALWLLQLVGATYVDRVVTHASDVYGTFAVVFGLLVWIALLARVALLSGEINVVRSNRFWPRSLVGTSPTAGDRRAVAQTSEKEVFVPGWLGSRRRERGPRQLADQAVSR